MTRIPIIALLAAPSFALPAAAQETGPPERGARGGVTISAEVAGVSDYRFRGISRSGRDPALQASATVETSGGLYAGAWGSTLGDSAIGDLEIDLFAGFETAILPGTLLDIGANYVTFHGDDGPSLAGSPNDYFEPYASISHTLGPVQARIGAAYAPDQDAIGGDNLYVYGEARAGIPLTPVTLAARLGRSEGALAPGTDGYYDWSLGGEYVLGPAILGARYVDTDIDRTGVRAFDRLSRPTVVVSVALGF